MESKARTAAALKYRTTAVRSSESMHGVNPASAKVYRLHRALTYSDPK
jgi:hypothetical protein